MSGILMAAVSSTTTPLVATINAGPFFASNFNTSSWTFGNTTCSASGGTPPYSYSWAYVSSSGGTWGFAGSSTVATVAPRVTSVAQGTEAQAVLRCTVTDSAGVPVVAQSNTADYFYENIF